MRILSRTEKLLLILAGAFAFVFVTAVASPGLQTMVAAVACPSGGDVEAVVVRYPHVPETRTMVRNSPLVCLESGGPVLASHWRVLPALFALGVVNAGADVAIGSLLFALVRRNRTDQPRPPKRAADTIRFLPLLIAMPFVGASTYTAYWWLAVDTPYRVSGCRSSSGGSATCYDGEPVYRLLTGVFGTLAVIGLAVWVLLLVTSLRRAQRFAAAVAGGARAPATLVAAEPTSTTINGRRQYRYRYRVEPPDGSPPFDVVERGTASPAGGPGGRVEVIYERDRTDNAFVVPPEWVPAR